MQNTKSTTKGGEMNTEDKLIMLKDLVSCRDCKKVIEVMLEDRSNNNNKDQIGFNTEDKDE